MTHQVHPSVTRQVVQLLAEHGFDGMAEAMEKLFNECMKIERQQALGVGPYQRGEARHGQANRPVAERQHSSPQRIQSRTIEGIPHVEPCLNTAKDAPAHDEDGRVNDEVVPDDHNTECIFLGRVEMDLHRVVTDVQHRRHEVRDQRQGRDAEERMADENSSHPARWR